MAGANVMVRNIEGTTPLHSAVSYTDRPVVIEALLKAGAHPMARDEKGNTPCMC